eukprot:PhF_6_TR40530/c0_g1_i2/m.60718
MALPQPLCPNNNLNYRAMPLAQPDLISAKRVVEESLKSHFDRVEVRVMDCPTLLSWGLASEGLCGDGKILDIGGVPLMFNPDMQGTQFDLQHVLHGCGLGGSGSGRRLVTGAGAGANTDSVGNSEWVGNCLFENGTPVRNDSLVSYITDMNTLPQPYTVCPCPTGTCCCGCLANVYVSQGKSNQPVLNVRVEGRKKYTHRPNDWHETELNRLVRLAMGKLARAPHEVFGMGGAVKVSGDSQMVHIMPPYYPLRGARPSPTPLLSMKGWGEVFFETRKTLICLPVLLSSDGGRGDLGLRLEHTHFYSEDKQLSGHYHFDMSDHVSAEGFYSFAKEVIKVDPKSS